MVVLVVDDHELLRFSTKAILQKEGFHVIEAEDGTDAWKIVLEIGSTITLLLSDIQMPRMDGFSLATCVRELHPKLPILLMTGQALSIRDHPLNSYIVLRKPFLRQDLIDAVWKLLTDAAIEDNSNGSRSRAFLSELREHWQAKAQKAKERYDQCSLHLRNILAEYNQGLIPTPDGRLSVRQALIQESAARQEHVRILQILSNIMENRA